MSSPLSSRGVDAFIGVDALTGVDEAVTVGLVFLGVGSLIKCLMNFGFLTYFRGTFISLNPRLNISNSLQSKSLAVFIPHGVADQVYDVGIR